MNAGTDDLFIRVNPSDIAHVHPAGATLMAKEAE